MSFLSFLSSHRLHWGAHRERLEDFRVHLDHLAHDANLETAANSPGNGSAPANPPTDAGAPAKSADDRLAP